ncbi:hypothetical protein HHI36_024443 [Cryptolaemus montrouzieri]|uniref:Uncharacterized protein n=1 Tax=Cryptolaemus montrouzieri TaxID=559131 RepID=A0ABD2MVI6_9CUCU
MTGRGHHETRHKKIGETWRRQTYLRTDIRRNSWGAEGISGERDQRRRYLHRTCETEDRHRHGRRIRSETSRTHPVRIRRLSRILKLRPQERTNIGPFQDHKRHTLNLPGYATLTSRIKAR